MPYKIDPSGYYAKINDQWRAIQTDKSGSKFIECKACCLTEILGSDLNPKFHKGVTIGKRGRILYWYFIWHGATTGNATLVTPEIPASKAYISGNQVIRIYLTT